MEEIVTCNICTQQFDSANFIPKMLECGHTYCSPCLTKLSEEKSSCPNCKVEIKRTEGSLPINYNTLKAVEFYKSKNYSGREVLTSIQNMKKEFVERKDNILKKKNQMMSSLDILDKCLEKLEELAVSENLKIDTLNTKKILNELGEELTKTVDPVDVKRSDDVKSSVSLLLADFEDSEKYLKEIYKRVENGEKVFAVHKIADDVKYGKVSLYENKLFFHSLSLSEVPKEASLIWFDELKQCANNKNFFTFINICCNEKGVSRVIIIKMFDKEKSHPFIRLCTGEFGPSYKGASFVKGGEDNLTQTILFVKDLFENGRRSSKVIDYNISDAGDIFKCKSNQIYLGIPEILNSFLIFLATKDCNAISQIIGEIISPSNLNDCINYDHSSFLKIVDCGIILDV